MASVLRLHAVPDLFLPRYTTNGSLCICTAFMALGMMLPGMIAGWLQESLGYQLFFIWIMGCTLVTFGVTALLKIDPEFGKK